MTPVVPNGHSVSNFLEWQEMAICVGERNGTIASKLALNNLCLGWEPTSGIIFPVQNRPEDINYLHGHIAELSL